MKKCIMILSGGSLEADFVRLMLEKKQPDFVITADHGLVACRAAGLIPDLIVGDFDSAPAEVVEEYRQMFEEHGKPVIRTFPVEKDETDTELAITTALQYEPESICILGATGTRLDHTLANISLLLKPLAAEVRAEILDPWNRIFLADEPLRLSVNEAYGPYFSLMPVDETVAGLTIRGAKYELRDAELPFGSSLCISNEFRNPVVEISMRQGILAVFETRDEPLRG